MGRNDIAVQSLAKTKEEGRKSGLLPVLIVGGILASMYVVFPLLLKMKRDQ